MGRGKKERETGRKFNWKERVSKSLSDSKVAASWRDAFQFVKVARFWRPAIIVHLRFPAEFPRTMLKDTRHANKRIVRFERTRSITETLGNREDESKEFMILTRGRVRKERERRNGRKETAILIYRSLVCSRREPPATSRVERLNIK